MLDICKTINLFIAGGFGVKNNKKTRKFLKMWANLEIGHPQGMKEKVLESVSGSPQLREPSGIPQEFLRKPSGIPQEIPVGKAASFGL